MADSPPRELSLAIDGARTTALLYPAMVERTRPAVLVLAHGAGAAQRHPFMTTVSHGLAQRGIDVLTFNFLYMEQKRRVPDRMPQLVACFRAAMTAAREQVPGAADRLFIGGKSMGGRVATHVAAEDPALAISGIILLGYPLHPPGRPDKTRDAHLPAVRRPMLFVQGSRDAFGTADEIRAFLPRLQRATLHEVSGGDHSFKVPRRDPQAQAAVYDDVQRTIVEWMESVIAERDA